MSYEECMKELESIIQKLEDGDVKFDEASALFERGASLCKELNEKFKQAKGKITVITETLGAMLEENFE